MDGSVNLGAPKARSELGDAEQGRWLTSIDPQAFALPRTARERGGDDVGHPAIGARFVVDLPARGELELVINGLVEVVDGVTTMIGSLANEANGDFVLSLEGDKLLGTIEDGEHIWLIEPQESGGHLLRQVHRDLIPRVPDDEVGPELGTVADILVPTSLPIPMAGTSGGVDVLFLYASDVINPSLRASDIVGRFTLVRNNSLISTNNSITSVGVYPVASSFAGLDRYAISLKMVNRSTPFTQLDNWMVHTNADIAFLMLTEDASAVDFPGYGRVGGHAYILQEGLPFALSTITYALGDNTAVHELGHVFGGRHERSGTLSELYYPVVASDCSWMTIMGGYLKPCVFDGLPATNVRINYFSNPSLAPAAAGGNVIGVPGRSDMKSWLESSMPVVSAWRNNGANPAPTSSPVVSHENLMCWGGNLIKWTAVSGATEYRLFQSISSSFIAPTQVYQGGGIAVHANVPSSGAYYRVQACNSSGCSNYAGTEYAEYYTGCL
ncbi:hypothetical protein [Dokdonella sp.]|uniref:hypothetical protein n=1 Tax=Dokdonella sp. TaxID=2291710 RepID=UPI003AF7A5A3